MSAKLGVGLVFGGRSGEHEVSVVCAGPVAAALGPSRYEVVPIAIDRSGRWAAPATAAEWGPKRIRCEARCLALPLPLFVKPARLRSSVGIGKVKGAGQVAGSVEVALRYDDMVIVEEGTPGREIEVAVLDGEAPLASLPGEVVPGHEFCDFAEWARPGYVSERPDRTKGTRFTDGALR